MVGVFRLTFGYCSAIALASAGLFAFAGCGGSSDHVNIGGRVTRTDGAPLVAAKVTFRSPETGRMAFGFTDRDGRYVLGTSRPGEGIPPGEYYVTVAEDRGPEESPRPPTVHRKYANAHNSGLTFQVEPGGKRVFDITLDPP